MSYAVQLLTSLAFTSCLLSSFQGDTSDLLTGLIETNASVFDEAVSTCQLDFSKKHYLF